MYLRARALTRLSHDVVSTSSKHQGGHFARQPIYRYAPTVRRYPVTARAYYHRVPLAATTPLATSGSNLSAVVVVIGLAVGGALLYPRVTSTAKDSAAHHTTPTTLYPVNYTDSYLAMPSDGPLGRPGTLTPDQEVKLRELWAATMRVFGDAAPVVPEVNGADTASVTAASDATDKDGKKEKKKSRLHVFKRSKGEKGAGAESTSTSGTATPSDVSSFSIADEDDKHGQNKDFKAALANMSPEKLRWAFWSMVKHDHPDGLLLRFLRARKWDVEKALVMMISTMHWRLTDMHVDDDIIKNGEEAALKDSKSSDPKVKKEGEDFLAQMRLGKSYLHGMDADGRPMCIVRARLHRAGEQSEASLERFTVYTIETARMFLRPPVDTAVSPPSLPHFPLRTH